MLYLIIIFLSSFLLFQVQPLIAKLILPLFGGGAAVWSACLLFFQTFLLLGYFYSHCLTKLNNITKQASIHGVFLLGSLYFLPINLTDSDLTKTISEPRFNILIILMISVGLPYFMLATTGPLIQRWLSYIDTQKLPYKLYSLSNIGSLLALLSFPFFIEPLLSSGQQLLFWSLAYLLFVMLFLWLSFLMIKHKNLSFITSSSNPINQSVSKTNQILWLSLSALGVILLMATTNAMTQNIPPVPFLWVLPLSLYLLTFIISFHSPHWYVRWYWFVLFSITSFAAILLYFIGSQFDIISQIVLYSLILLSACMICHGELARLKPGVEKLTLFYLYLSLGGFLGSVLITFVAQNIFSQFYEFPIAIFLVYVIFIASIVTSKANKLLLSSCILSLLVLLTLFTYVNHLFSQTNVISSRNFYGILSVKDVPVNGVVERRLIDGSTSHGTQSLQDNQKQIPRSYYRAKTGVALALKQLGQGPNVNAGFIGLGAGTLAAYGRSGDKFTFYELNPNVVNIARSHFTYLDDSKAEIEIILGDGRISLANELVIIGSRQYKLLVLDAFSSGAIPIHLLTKEAFKLYWQQLAKDGILAIHISNSHLDLTPLVRGLAKNANKDIFYVKTLAELPGQHDVEWVLLTNKDNELNNNLSRFSQPWPVSKIDTLIWTDDFSNLLSIIR